MQLGLCYRHHHQHHHQLTSETKSLLVLRRRFRCVGFSWTVADSEYKSNDGQRKLRSNLRAWKSCHRRAGNVRNNPISCECSWYSLSSSLSSSLTSFMTLVTAKPILYVILICAQVNSFQRVIFWFLIKKKKRSQHWSNQPLAACETSPDRQEAFVVFRVVAWQL